MNPTERKGDGDVEPLPHVDLDVEQVEVVDVIDRHTIGQVGFEEHSQMTTIGFGSNAFGIPLIVIKTVGCGCDLMTLAQQQGQRPCIFEHLATGEPNVVEQVTAVDFVASISMQVGLTA